jgi:hypothetical protein
MKNTFHILRSTLPRYRSELARAAAEQPALAPYPEAGAVLAALGRGSALSHAERDGIVRALVSEKQASAHPLWPAMLILAFEPALRRLCLRVDAATRGEDVEQELVGSLLEAAATVRVSATPLVMTLHRATARKFFRRLHARTPRGVEVALDEQTPEVPWHCEQPAFVQCAAREVLRACERLPGATAAALARAGVGPGAERGEMQPEASPAEAKRARDRLRHRGDRVLARVRKALGVDVG